jgi:hypothetical protein
VSQFILLGGPYRHIIIAQGRRDISVKQRFPVFTYIGVVIVRARVRALSRG